MNTGSDQNTGFTTMHFDGLYSEQQTIITVNTFSWCKKKGYAFPTISSTVFMMIISDVYSFQNLQLILDRPDSAARNSVLLQELRIRVVYKTKPDPNPVLERKKN